MNLQSILNDSILSNHIVYVPAIIPVDYGGTFVCNASVHLIDGTFLSRSSLALAQGGDELRRTEQTIALLQAAVNESGLSPRCDYLHPERTKMYRMLTGSAQPRFLASACLCGEHCRYDGNANAVPAVAQLVTCGAAIPVCPEISGGLPTPRTPCEILQGQVKDADGADHTAAFLLGAQRTLATAQTLGIKRAVLKEKSPSCGSQHIYDGSFTRTVIDGQGICTALLRAHGIEITSEEDYR